MKKTKLLFIPVILLLFSSSAGLKSRAYEKCVKIPGGWTAGGEKAVIKNSSDIIEAVDISSGKTLWKSQKKYLLLGIYGQNAVLLEHNRIIMKNIPDNKIVFQSETAGIPEWADIFSVYRPRRGLRFDYAADIDGSMLVLKWEATVYSLGGYRGLKVSSYDLKRVKINLETGEVTAIKKEPMYIEKTAPEGMENTCCFKHLSGKVWSQEPVEVNGKIVRVDFIKNNGKQYTEMFFLDREGGKAAGRVRLEGDYPEESVHEPWVTMDGLHLLQRMAGPHESISPKDYDKIKHKWKIYSLTDGKYLYEAEIPLRAYEVSISGDMMFMAVSKELKDRSVEHRLEAVRRGKGVLWKRDILFKKYYPPIP